MKRNKKNKQKRIEQKRMKRNKRNRKKTPQIQWLTYTMFTMHFVDESVNHLFPLVTVEIVDDCFEFPEKHDSDIMDIIDLN